MKKKLFIACMLGILSLGGIAKAQISVNFNVGSQPLWGPTGYDRADYYYLPDIETYYSVPDRKYVYLENSKWIFSRSLPSRYSGYNLYNGYKVVLNRPKPYLAFKTDRVTYAKYKAYKGKQKVIKYSTDPKYFVIKGHPKHPHGMAPGQAKKLHKTKFIKKNSGRDNDHHENDKGHENKGHGNGKH